MGVVSQGQSRERATPMMYCCISLHSGAKRNSFDSNAPKPFSRNFSEQTEIQSGEGNQNAAQPESRGIVIDRYLLNLYRCFGVSAVELVLLHNTRPLQRRILWSEMCTAVRCLSAISNQLEMRGNARIGCCFLVIQVILKGAPIPLRGVQLGGGLLLRSQQPVVVVSR